MRILLITVMTLVTAVFAASVVAGDQHKVQGVVKTIKTSDKKITVSHGPIASMGMPGMTMDFAVYDPSMLDEVTEGHKISMMVEVDKDGKFTIMELEDQGMAEGMPGNSMSMQGGDHEHMQMHNH
jgi:Cu(I)/Ag(I) efflux system protein CusF